jgi:hypothetical protein
MVRMLHFKWAAISRLVFHCISRDGLSCSFICLRSLCKNKTGQPAPKEVRIRDLAGTGFGPIRVSLPRGCRLQFAWVGFFKSLLRSPV